MNLFLTILLFFSRSTSEVFNLDLKQKWKISSINNFVLCSQAFVHFCPLFWLYLFVYFSSVDLLSCPFIYMSALLYLLIVIIIIIIVIIITTTIIIIIIIDFHYFIIYYYIFIRLLSCFFIIDLYLPMYIYIYYIYIRTFTLNLCAVSALSALLLFFCLKADTFVGILLCSNVAIVTRFDSVPVYVC